MKTQFSLIKTVMLSGLLSSTLFFASCNNDSDDHSPVNDPAKKEQVEKVLALREDLDFVSRFVDQAMGDDVSQGRTSFAKSFIAKAKNEVPCGEGVEEELPDGSIKVSLDFTDGCETEEGIIVAGQVVMIFRFTESGIEYSIEFIEYRELNGANEGEVINGTVSGSFILDFEASKFLQEMEQDVTIDYPNSTEARYITAMAAEMTEAGMQVSSMTTSGNLADGGQFAITASKTLVYDFSCQSNFPVRGEEIMTFQGNTIVVNYGNGTCDSQFTVK